MATALQGNFALLEATDSLSSSRYRYSASVAQFYPKLTPRVSRSADQSLMGFDVSQAVPWTGGTVTASANYRLLENAESPFSRASSYSFVLSQPLLRGFGPNASLYDLRNSRRDREGRERGLELERQRMAVDVARAFYQVVEQRSLLAVARQSLVRTQSLQRASEARLEVGLVSKLDVYRAQLQASQAQEAMVRSEAGLQDALERFRFLLGNDAADPMEPAAVELAPDLPADGPEPLPVLVQRALSTRLDLLEVRDQVSDARRSASLARQNLLPQFDLNLGVTKEGFGTSFSSAWNAGDQRVNLFFSASYPLERSSDLVNKAQAELSLSGSQRHLRQNEMEIERQVRAAVRELDQLRKSVELQAPASTRAERAPPRAPAPRAAARARGTRARFRRRLPAARRRAGWPWRDRSTARGGTTPASAPPPAASRACSDPQRSGAPVGAALLSSSVNAKSMGASVCSVVNLSESTAASAARPWR